MDKINTWIHEVFKKFRELFGNLDGVITMSNATFVGVHDRVMSFISEDDLSQAGLLVYRTHEASALTCRLANGEKWPAGVALGAASKGEPVSVALLGSASSTMRMLSAGPILAGEPVYSTAGGRVQMESKAPGTYYRVGLALTSASKENLWIEVDPSASAAVMIHASESKTPVAEPVAQQPAPHTNNDIL